MVILLQAAKLDPLQRVGLGLAPKGFVTPITQVKGSSLVPIDQALAIGSIECIALPIWARSVIVKIDIDEWTTIASDSFSHGWNPSEVKETTLYN
jgi:hypothetical protein